MALKISAVREVNPLDSRSILLRSRTSFEKQLYFPDSLANLCFIFYYCDTSICKNRDLGLVWFFLFFIIQITENPYEKYMRAQMQSPC